VTRAGLFTTASRSVLQLYQPPQPPDKFCGPTSLQINSAAPPASTAPRSILRSHQPPQPPDQLCGPHRPSQPPDQFCGPTSLQINLRPHRPPQPPDQFCGPTSLQINSAAPPASTASRLVLRPHRPPIQLTHSHLQCLSLMPSLRMHGAKDTSILTACCFKHGVNISFTTNFTIYILSP
jgi:hypothetical protein